MRVGSFILAEVWISIVVIGTLDIFKYVNRQELPDLTVRVANTADSHWYDHISSSLWNKLFCLAIPASMPWTEGEWSLILACALLWPIMECSLFLSFSHQFSALGIWTSCKEGKKKKKKSVWRKVTFCIAAIVPNAVSFSL